MMGIVYLASFVFWMGAANAAQGREAWQMVYEDALLRVEVDMASIRHDARVVTFRERHIPAVAEIDPASLRRIVEIQARRSVDCNKKRFALLSRAVFSDRDALVGYEASKKENPKWVEANADRETKLFELICGSRL